MGVDDEDSGYFDANAVLEALHKRLKALAWSVVSAHRHAGAWNHLHWGQWELFAVDCTVTKGLSVYLHSWLGAPRVWLGCGGPQAADAGTKLVRSVYGIVLEVLRSRKGHHGVLLEGHEEGQETAPKDMAHLSQDVLGEWQVVIDEGQVHTKQKLPE